MSTQLKGDIQINADPTRFVQGITRAEQSLSKLQQGTTKTGQSLRTLDQSTTKSSQSTQRLTQSTTQASQAMQRMGQSTQQAAAGAARMSQSAAQATQATSRMNVGMIGTAATIGGMGAGLVTAEASLSNYTKAAYKVEKAELKVEKTTLASQKAKTMLLNANNMLAKAEASGKKTREEILYYQEQVANYTEDYALKVDEEKLAKERLAIVNMDYADTQKTMASSLVMVTLNTVAMAAQMIQAKVAITANAAATKASTAANIANSKALKFLGIDLNAAKANFASASMAMKGFTINSTGARVAVTGFSKATQVASMTIKGLWASLGPIGILTILATSLYTAWETSQQFRDGVMWLTDGMQDLFEMVKKVIVPLQWLDEGLKALGINVGESIDKWQEQNAVIGEAETQLYDADAAVKQLDTDVDHLTTTVNTDTAAIDQAGAAIAELDTDMHTMSNTIASVAIPSVSKFSDAMLTAGSSANQFRIDSAKSFQEASNAAKEWAANTEQRTDQAERELLEFAAEHANIFRNKGPEDAKNYADKMHSYIQNTIQTVQDGGGDMSTALGVLGVSFESLGFTVDKTMDSMEANVGDGMQKITGSITSTSGAVITLMAKIDLLSKKKSNVLNDLKDITDVSQLTAHQLAKIESEYNRLKMNGILDERGLPNLGQHGATEEGKTVYVMGDGESALKADGSIDYDLLQRIGNISAANLAKIKKQTQDKLHSQAGEFLVNLGLAHIKPGGTSMGVTHQGNLGTLTDESIATLSSVSANTHATGIDGRSGGLYANQGQNIRHSPTRWSEEANQLLRRGVYVPPQTFPSTLKAWRKSHGDSWKKGCKRCNSMDRRIAFWEGSRQTGQYRIYDVGSPKHIEFWGATNIDRAVALHKRHGRGLEKWLTGGATIADVEAWLVHPAGAKTLGASRHKMSIALPKFKTWFSIYKEHIEDVRAAGINMADPRRANEINNMLHEYAYRRASEVGMSPHDIGKMQSEINTLLQSKERRTNRPYMKQLEAHIASINKKYGTDIVADAAYRVYQSGNTSLGKVYSYDSKGINLADIITSVIKKADQQKRDRELAEQLRKLEMKEAAERKAQAEQEAQQRRQDIYESQMKSYNEDMALYNMIIRMFPGQTPDYKPTPPTLQTSSSHATPQQARDLLTPVQHASYHTQYLRTREDLGAGGEGGTTAHNIAVSYIRELMAQGKKDDAIKVMNNILKDEYLDSEHTTPDMIQQVANLYAQYDPTGAKNMLSTIHDHESQRHADYLARAGLWKSEYEGHDVYQLRQIVELHAI